MRHNDAHHNSSLVQICTQWNLDRNPFIYVSCLPEGTELRCIAAVLPLLLLQCWHFGWKQDDGFFRNLQLRLRRIAPHWPAGKLWRDSAPTAWRPCEWDALLKHVQTLGGKMGCNSSLQGKAFACSTRWAHLHVLIPVWPGKGEQGTQVLQYIVLCCVVKGRGAFRSTILKPTATAFLNPRGKKI